MTLASAAFTPTAAAGCGAGALTHPQALALGGAFTKPERAASAPGALDGKAKPAATTHDTIVGLWNLQFFADNQLVDVAFDAWHSDGTEVLNDFTNPTNGNVCLGAWQQSGSNTYTLKHPSWYFDNNGNLLGIVVIHEKVHLTAHGNKFCGTYKDDVYDTSGNLLEELTGTLTATRITAD